MNRLPALAVFAVCLFIGTEVMNLIGAVFGLGLILTVGLGAGMVYAVRTTETGVRPRKWWTRPERRTVADEAPEVPA